MQATALAMMPLSDATPVVGTSEEMGDILPPTPTHQSTEDATAVIAALLESASGSPEQRAAVDAAREAIDASQFPDDLLEVWSLREEEALKPPPAAARRTSSSGSSAPLSQGGFAAGARGQAPGRQLPKEVRGGAVWLMSQLTMQMRLPPEAVAQAVTVFDIYCHRMDGKVEVEDLPSIGVAICCLIHKMDMPDSMVWQSAAAWLSRWLKSSGHATVPDTRELLKRHEKSILDALQWQINHATVESWLLAFCARFDAASGGFFRESLTWVAQQGIALARVILPSATVFELNPRRFASALCCFGLVASRLLPLHTLLPDSKMSMDEWEQLYLQSGWDKSLPKFALPEQFKDGMCKLIEMSMDSKLSALCQDCLILATVTQELFGQA
mmetsp:Transcript_41499/g.109441  ORF Transcript_41499/g.109441 Transcript_41499/m.109441 type:complete len:385 (-) Transcript_41499:410-1564(-)